MHRSCVTTLVIDCEDIEACIHFWTNALGVEVEGRDDVYAYLGTAVGSLRLFLQQVPEGKSAKSRMHIDFETDNIEAEVERLERFGGRRVQHVERWWIMADPCGNEFCVVNGRSQYFYDRARMWDV
ncbi:MAG: VOC family protein [Chloroflexales bacterium]|nr:VOC family protein [Chloroflexales bacterium]